MIIMYRRSFMQTKSNSIICDLYGIIQKYGDDIKDADNKYKKCPNCERVKQPKNNTCIGR